MSERSPRSRFGNSRWSGRDYNLNNHSALQKESDGSLKIAMGPKPVAGVAESNWLPSPDGKPFTLTFRTYVPKEIVAREWAPPALERQR